MPLCDLSRETFVQYLAGLYEQAGWVTERAYNTGLTAGHDNPELLARALQQSLNDASDAEKLALIRAYPDLLGEAAIAGRLSRSANNEFTSAGLDRCSPEQIERFSQLNSLYWGRFGFPFVMAVQGSSIDSIINKLSERLHNDANSEIQNALTQVHRIARLRLDKLLSPDNKQRMKETPLAEPVGMVTDAASRAVSQVPDDQPAKAEYFSRITENQPPLFKRVLARVSATFTRTTLLACAFSFGFGWMMSRLMS